MAIAHLVLEVIGQSLSCQNVIGVTPSRRSSSAIFISVAAEVRPEKCIYYVVSTSVAHHISSGKYAATKDWCISIGLQNLKDKS